MSLKTCFAVLFNAYDAPNTPSIVMVYDKADLHSPRKSIVKYDSHH